MPEALYCAARAAFLTAAAQGAGIFATELFRSREEKALENAAREAEARIFAAFLN